MKKIDRLKLCRNFIELFISLKFVFQQPSDSYLPTKAWQYGQYYLIYLRSPIHRQHIPKGRQIRQRRIVNIFKSALLSSIDIVTPFYLQVGHTIITGPYAPSAGYIFSAITSLINGYYY